MGTANASTAARRFDSLLAGLQAGMLGTLIMLGWLALASAWYRRSIWTTANLMATTFYGESALRRSFAWTSLSGVALYLALYSILGAVFGLAVRNRGNRLQVTSIGVACALAWYYLAFGLLWKKLNPLIPLYTHDAPMLAGHLLYGALLGRFPTHLRGMWTSAPAPVTEPSVTSVDQPS